MSLDESVKLLVLQVSQLYLQASQPRFSDSESEDEADDKAKENLLRMPKVSFALDVISDMVTGRADKISKATSRLPLRDVVGSVPGQVKWH